MSNNYVLTPNGSFVSEDELYHYGVPGMKWGVRRYQNDDGTLTAAGKKRAAKATKRINLMYDRSNKWTRRKADRLHKKGKTAKAEVMEEMIRRNEKARANKIDAISKMGAKEFNKSSNKTARQSVYGQRFMARNQSSMMTGLSRLNEYTMQRGMRWASNFTFNKTLADMNVNQRYNYLDQKARYVSHPSNQ